MQRAPRPQHPCSLLPWVVGWTRALSQAELEQQRREEERRALAEKQRLAAEAEVRRLQAEQAALAAEAERCVSVILRGSCVPHRV